MNKKEKELTEFYLDKIYVENAINKFKLLNVKYDITKSTDTNINDFLVKYTNCFANINPPILFIKTKINYSFFRLRKLNEIKDFDNIKEYSYPKKNNQLGRANLPNKPVFYCSLSPITAINEMKKTDRDIKYVISKWKLKDNNKTINIVPAFTSNTEQHLNKMIKQAGITSTEQQKMYLQFIGEQLLSNNYSVSAFLSYNIIYENNIDAITYPSVIDNKYPNMAISPKLIAKGDIILDKVYIVEIGKPKEISLDKIGIFHKNNVEWVYAKDLNKNDKYMQEFEKDFAI